MNTPTETAALLATLTADATEVYPKSGTVKTIVENALGLATRCQVTSTTGTGSALEVALNFTPKAVIVLNETTGAVAVQVTGAADAKGWKITTAASFMSSAGITLGTDKVTLGTDSDLNASGNVIRVWAFDF